MVLRTAGSLAALLVLTACPPPGPTQDCQDMCNQLSGCGFLPSILGASSQGGANVPAVDALTDCESRCGFSSNSSQFAEVQDCTSHSSCSAVASCLHAAFPDAPITGVSRLVLVSKGGTVTSDDGGVLGGCSADAGGQLSFAQGFVEVWGARQYSQQVVCQLPLSQAFENVPASQMVPMGFQILQGGSCAEYGTAMTVAAGQDPLTVTIDLSTPPSTCAPPTPAAVDAGVPTDGANHD